MLRWRHSRPFWVERLEKGLLKLVNNIGMSWWWQTFVILGTQCGKYKIFLSLRFYVRSILGVSRKNCHFRQLWRLWILLIWKLQSSKGLKSIKFKIQSVWICYNGSFTACSFFKQFFFDIFIYLLKLVMISRIAQTLVIISNAYKFSKSAWLSRILSIVNEYNLFEKSNKATTWPVEDGATRINQ